ncbi:MAG: PD-(D/E)XK nuclease family protein [Betaproteobacteria bacterium]|nr:PD-(D/E)XK nuclease family protein [Betaproteobacteria bacterium]
MPLPPFTAAARRFLDEAGAATPDFSALTVLVPHHAAARDFLAGLRCALGGRVIVPPRCLTLPALAATVPGRPAAEPDSRRLADIYGFLRRTGRLQERQLWPSAAELARLLRELDDSQQALPTDFDDFQLCLERAYRRKLGSAMSIEARLAHELWHAFQRLARPDAGRDYAERLAWLAEHASAPLFHLDLPGLTAVERAFLARYGESQQVIPLPVAPAYPERAAALAEAWAGAAPLAEAACLDGAVGLQGAAGIEQAARAAEARVLLWLAEGRERIGIVALDRLLARRLRALLERRQILLQDETGWTFSTAAVSHVLDRWFGLLQDDCYYRELLDFLKSPYLFADLDPRARQAAASGLELALRRRGVVEGWERMQRLARESGLVEAAAVLDRMQAARALFGAKRLSLAAWQDRLLQALDKLGALPAFEADLAGRQLLAVLRRLQAETGDDAATYRMAEWRRWLLLQLDQLTFVDDRVESPLRLTHLRAARLREFDAVLLLGADAARLPERAAPGLFNEAVRRELGLPAQAEKEAELRAALADVLARAPRVFAVWQGRRDGEPVALSPWLETLDLWHRARFGRGLRQPEARHAEVVAEAVALPEAASAARAAGLPERVTVSGWQSLVACPYLFYARHLLGLNELDEVPEEMDKRDYGTLIHAALAKFHEDRLNLLEVERTTLDAELASAVNAAFAEAGQRQYLAEAWRLRWQRRQTAYLDWAVDWARQGHRFVKAEAKASQAVAVGAAEIVLEGRLDRLDAGPAGPAVLDYKTNPAQTLRKKLKQPGEDVQLPCYAWLADAAEAGFVVLDEDKVAWLAWRDGLAEAAQAEAARFAATFSVMAEGAALPAHGAASLCRHCEMRGLCRREHQP